MERELVLLSTIDVIESVRAKNISDSDKQLYIIGVLSELIAPLSQSHIFNDDEDFFTHLSNGIKDYTRQTFVNAFTLCHNFANVHEAILIC